MAESFYTILTTIGQAKIANAQVTGEKVNLTEIAVGDGNGAYYNPDQTQTALKNEVWRGNIGAVQIDDENPNWIVIEGVIPANVGGFFVREVGIFDDAGDMVAVGKFPETYKPVMEQGSAKDLYLRVIIEVANASAVTLRVDPSVIIASRKYVDDKVAPVEQKVNQTASSLAAHLNDDVTDAHQIKNIEGLQAALDSKADKQQENWIAPTLLNGFQNYTGVANLTPAGYRKNSLGKVEIRGIITGTTTADTTILFYLPVGYRTSKIKEFGVICNVSGTRQITHISIGINGEVAIVANSGITFDWISLSDIVPFDAEQ